MSEISAETKPKNSKRVSKLKARFEAIAKKLSGGEKEVIEIAKDEEKFAKEVQITKGIKSTERKETKTSGGKEIKLKRGKVLKSSGTKELKESGATSPEIKPKKPSRINKLTAAIFTPRRNKLRRKVATEESKPPEDIKVPENPNEPDEPKEPQDHEESPINNNNNVTEISSKASSISLSPKISMLKNIFEASLSPSPVPSVRQLSYKRSCTGRTSDLIKMFSPQHHFQAEQKTGIEDDVDGIKPINQEEDNVDEEEAVEDDVASEEADVDEEELLLTEYEVLFDSFYNEQAEGDDKESVEEQFRDLTESPILNEEVDEFEKSFKMNFHLN